MDQTLWREAVNLEAVLFGGRGRKGQESARERYRQVRAELGWPSWPSGAERPEVLVAQAGWVYRGLRVNEMGLWERVPDDHFREDVLVCSGCESRVPAGEALPWGGACAEVLARAVAPRGRCRDCGDACQPDGLALAQALDRAGLGHAARCVEMVHWLAQATDEQWGVAREGLLRLVGGRRQG